MARGRLLRTKVKEALKVAEATELGKAKGIIKGHQKKPFLEELKEHIGKAVDRIDPLEILAVACLTPLVKQYVDASPKISALVLTWGSLGIVGLTVGSLLSSIIHIPDIEKTPQAEFMNWCLAFAFSFCIVRWGDKMLMSGVGDLGKIIGLATA